MLNMFTNNTNKNQMIQLHKYKYIYIYIKKQLYGDTLTHAWHIVKTAILYINIAFGLTFAQQLKAFCSGKLKIKFEQEIFWRILFIFHGK